MEKRKASQRDTNEFAAVDDQDVSKASTPGPRSSHREKLRKSKGRAEGERYLVIGGAGFLGSYIVQSLIDRGETSVSVFGGSLPVEVDTIERVSYFSGDILNTEQFLGCLSKVSPTVVFHTVSPSVRNKGLKETYYYDVNVDGTRAILSACQDAGVKVFVYTSSTSVVWSGQNLSGPNEEEITIPEKPYSIYAHSKALAEQMVLRENCFRGMKTVALRPPGMVGPRDRISMWRLVQAFKRGQHKYQMGPNTNLIDYSYVGNIADAHILAADRILENLNYPATEDLVSGEAFFLSDGSPRPYWDFPRLVWRLLAEADGTDSSSINDVVIIPRWLCFVFAFISELLCKIFGGTPRFPRFAVNYATREQWYSIEKARNLLGYKPCVPFEDGVRMMVEWWVGRGAEQYAKKNRFKSA